MDEIRHDLPVCLQRLDGRDLIICHEEGISFDIGTEDGSEFACDFLFVGHWITFGLGFKEDDTSWKCKNRSKIRSDQDQL